MNEAAAAALTVATNVEVVMIEEETGGALTDEEVAAAMTEMAALDLATEGWTVEATTVIAELVVVLIALVAKMVALNGGHPHPPLEAYVLAFN